MKLGQPTSTGGAPFTLAGMISHIFVIEILIAFIAKVRFVKESAVGIAPVVVLTLFDETNGFVRRGGSSMNDHMRWIDGHDFDLVPWQGKKGKVCIRATWAHQAGV